MAVQQTLSPIDGSVVAQRSTLEPEEIELTLDAAHDARSAWRATPITDRIEICERAVRLLEAEADDVAVELARQMGRPVRYGANEIRRGFQERARYMMSVAPDQLGVIPVPDRTGFTRWIRRDPIGTVLVVAPWNYPYLCAVNSIVPALLAGNTVVLKHATQTVLSGERIARAFAAAGAPEGVLASIVATHADVAAMIRDPRVDGVVFTGSVEGGLAIRRAASERFIGTGLELGGKDPAYIRPDCDLDDTVAETVDGAFFNSGQSCCAIERLYVHTDIYDDFVERYVAATRALVLGNPLDSATTLGPMVSSRAAEIVRSQIDMAVAKGARVLVDESEQPAALRGTPYMGPVVLVDVDHTMAVMTEESFGPAIGIMRVGSDDEAVRLMNDSPYGLTASIWTSDPDAAVRLGGEIETGTVYMNRCDYVDPTLAWTGVKNSGVGHALSVLGFDAYTRPKSFHLRSVP